MIQQKVVNLFVELVAFYDVDYNPSINHRRIVAVESEKTHDSAPDTSWNFESKHELDLTLIFACFVHLVDRLKICF